MLELIAAVYGFLCWLIFKKLKLVPVNDYTVVTAIDLREAVMPAVVVPVERAVVKRQQPSEPTDAVVVRIGLERGAVHALVHRCEHQRQTDAVEQQRRHRDPQRQRLHPRQWVPVREPQEAEHQQIGQMPSKPPPCGTIAARENLLELCRSELEGVDALGGEVG